MHHAKVIGKYGNKVEEGARFCVVSARILCIYLVSAIARTFLLSLWVSIISFSMTVEVSLP